MRKLIDIFLNLKIKAKLLISFTLIIAVTIISVGISSQIIWKKSKIEDTRSFSRYVVEQTAYNLMYWASNTEDFIKTQLIDSMDFVSTLFISAENEGDSSGEITKQKGFKQFSSNLFQMRPEIKEIYVEDSGGIVLESKKERNIISFSGKTRVPSEIQKRKDEILRLRGKSLWVSEPGNKDLLYMSRVIMDYKNLKYAGIITVGIDAASIRKLNYETADMKKYPIVSIIINTNSKSYFFLGKTEEAEYIKYVEKTLVRGDNRKNQNNDIILLDGKQYMVYSSISPDGKWETVNMVSLEGMFMSIRQFQWWIFLTCIIVTLIAITISFIISRNMSENIKLLIKKVELTQAGNFKVKIQPKSHDEIGQLALKFNAMSEEINKLIDTVYLEQLEKNKEKYRALKFEYDALQTQINPHFLYNVLETMNSLSIMNGDNRISEMITSLSILLRNTFGKKDSLIKLQEELNYIKQYLNIQKIMYGDRLHIEYDIDEDTLDSWVPRLILQPVVENSIVHGIEQKRGTGRVEILVGYHEDHLIHIKVIDNGIGMEETKLLSLLNENSDGTEDEKHAHIGLASVEKRIKILFGQQYGLSFFSEPGHGTMIEIVIPYVRDKEEVTHA